eukprot:g8987.t1
MAQFTAVAQAHAVPVKAVPVAVGGGGFDQSPMPIPMDMLTNQFGYAAAKRMLMMECGWPVGLADSILRSMSVTPYRVFLIDDSGSMGANDGNMLHQGPRGFVKVSCTRWKELVQCIKFHAKLAHIAQAPSEFRLLNGGNPVELGTPATMDGTNLQILFSLLDGQFGGGTPLCFHISQVVQRANMMNHSLRQNRQKLSFTIFTDGESSDGDIAAALRPLERLPVWTVVRLCTDQDNVVNYWNNVDDNLELEMDVLDDLFGEREEVVAHNPWINYCEPLHRLREFGSHFKCMDLLDESKLKGDHLRDTLSILLGGEPNSFPHPDVDPKALQAHVEMLLRDTPLVMDPKHLKMKPIIKVHRLGPSSGCVLQ